MTKDTGIGVISALLVTDWGKFTKSVNRKPFNEKIYDAAKRSYLILFCPILSCLILSYLRNIETLHTREQEESQE